MRARNNPLRAFRTSVPWVGALLATAWACASEPESQGPTIAAEILAAGRIRVDGHEMGTGDFLELVRQRVALANGVEEQLPAVTLVASEQVRNTTVPARVFEALRTTGVRFVHLEVGW